MKYTSAMNTHSTQRHTRRWQVNTPTPTRRMDIKTEEAKLIYGARCQDSITLRRVDSGWYWGTGMVPLPHLANGCLCGCILGSYTRVHAWYMSIKKLKHSNSQIWSHRDKGPKMGTLSCLCWQSYVAWTHSGSDSGTSQYWRKIAFHIDTRSWSHSAWEGETIIISHFTEIGGKRS